MISDIREYIKKVVKEIDSKYQASDNPFPLEGEVEATDRVDYQYHVVFNPVTYDLVEQKDSMATVPVTFRTFVYPKTDLIASFDEAFCEALLINSLMLDNSRLNGSNFIKGITTSSVTPIQIDGSAIYMFESTLNFKISYGIGD